MPQRSCSGRWVTGAALCCFFACAPEVPEVELADGDQVRVLRVTKGHELLLAKGPGRARLRLVGVYVFDHRVEEKSDITTFARAAVAFVETHTVGRRAVLRLERAAPDPRGRYLGYLELDGRDLNRLLVEEGQAAVYTEFPFSREADYLATEEQARRGVRGLWGGTATVKRLTALRQTWAAVRERRQLAPLADPLMVQR